MSIGLVLGILFIALKLMGYITWSWVWVTSPIWIELIVDVVLFVLFLVGVIAFGGD